MVIAVLLAAFGLDGSEIEVGLCDRLLRRHVRRVRSGDREVPSAGQLGSGQKDGRALS